jgi:hypothetical protein
MIENSEGYRKLLADVERDVSQGSFHDYRAKLAWVVARAEHYGEKTGLNPADILDAWEKGRNYWYMNYYQECNQPEIKADNVRVFDTLNELRVSIGDAGFICPACGQVTTSPYECNSGAVTEGKPCDWKVYGLFGHMGKGIYVFVKESVRGENMFMPQAWLPETATVP